MASYRFCRPDDIPLLVDAVNRCYGIHFPGSPALTVEAFRSLMKEIDVWPSNCMIALAGSDPIAILIGTKREEEVLAMWVGVASEYQRQRHALHILTSLGQKLAVLGPPRLIGEPPLDTPGAVELFAAVGFEKEAELTDFLHRGASVEARAPNGLVFPVSHDELEETQLLASAGDQPRAWIRSDESIAGCASNLQGLAIGTPLGLDAYLLYRQNSGEGLVDVLSAGSRDSSRESLYLELLLRELMATTKAPLRIPKLSNGELPGDVLEKLGFVAERRYARMAMQALPG